MSQISTQKVSFEMNHYSNAAIWPVSAEFKEIWTVD